MERAKHELSTALRQKHLPYISSDASYQALLMKLSHKLESLVQDYIDKSIKPTEQTVMEAGFKISDVNEVLLWEADQNAGYPRSVKSFSAKNHRALTPTKLWL